MKPKALLIDFYGTIVEEADNYIAIVCKKISQHSKVKMLGSEMWKYWHEVHVQMCNEAFNDAFHLQREIAEKSLQVLLDKVYCNLDSKDLIKIILHFWEAPKMFPGSKEVLSECNVPNIGDSYLLDVVGAKAVGIPVIWVNRNDKKLRMGDIFPDYAVKDLRELLDIMK